MPNHKAQESRLATKRLIVLALSAALLGGCAHGGSTGTGGDASHASPLHSATSRSIATPTITRTPTPASTPLAAHTCAPPYAPHDAIDSIFCADPASLDPARVIRIVDGDTLHVDLDGRDETVRLYGIDATERGMPCSDDASARLRELAGGEVRLKADARERDPFGRLLRYVYSSTGLSIDAEMADEGLARAWRKDGALRPAIIALEAGAMDAHRGCLWR